MTIRDGRSRKEPRSWKALRPEDIGAARLGVGGTLPLYRLPLLAHSNHLVSEKMSLASARSVYVARYLEIPVDAELVIEADCDVEIG